MRLTEAVGSLVAEFRGDAMIARGDSLGASFDGPARAIHCAEAIVAARERSGVRCRAGLHTGECELHGGQLRGVAVDMAAEILTRAAPGEVLVSRTVADLVAGAGIDFVDRGSHGLAAVGDSWQLLATASGRAAEQPMPRRRRCCSGAKGTTGRSATPGRWSACATPRGSDTWPVSCAIPTRSSTCSNSWPVTHRANAGRRVTTVF